MKSLLFRSDMLQAFIEGRKTQTRRLSGLEEINKEPDRWRLPVNQADDEGRWWFSSDDGRTIVVKPRLHPGELVYLKEAIEVHDAMDGDRLQGYLVIYPDQTPKMIWLKDLPQGFTPRSFYQKMFMPSWAARHFAKVLSVRAERVQAITTEDAIAEGIVPHYHTVQLSRPTLVNDSSNQYAELWDQINGEGSWARNVWDFAYTLERTERP